MECFGGVVTWSSYSSAGGQSRFWKPGVSAHSLSGKTLDLPICSFPLVIYGLQCALAHPLSLVKCSMPSPCGCPRQCLLRGFHWNRKLCVLCPLSKENAFLGRFLLSCWDAVKYFMPHTWASTTVEVFCLFVVCLGEGCLQNWSNQNSFQPGKESCVCWRAANSISPALLSDSSISWVHLLK